MIAPPAQNPHAGKAQGAPPLSPFFGDRVGTIPTTSVSFAGHTATHSRHPVHSADRICTSLSTRRAEGHTFAHLAQSMQLASRRMLRNGLASAANPSNPP